MLIVIGRVKCKPGQEGELVALLEAMQDASRREKGCLRYGFFAAVEDPQSFIAVEEWADREALDRHFGEQHLKDFSRGLLGHAAAPPDIQIHEVAATTPFPGSA